MGSNNGKIPSLSLRQALKAAAKVEKLEAATYRRRVEINQPTKGELYEKESRLANARRLSKIPITDAQIAAIIADCEARLAAGPGPRRTKGKPETNETPTEYAYRCAMFYRHTTAFKIYAEHELRRRREALTNA